MSAEQQGAAEDARIDESEIPSSSESELSDEDAELGSVEDGDWELARGGASLLTRLYEAIQQGSAAFERTPAKRYPQ